MNPRIVCAANRFENGPLLIGARHFDQHMHVQANHLGVKGTEPHE
jgi:Ran GTPase-activating protein (RanGAP) involved in mRNA processing and transport